MRIHEQFPCDVCEKLNVSTVQSNLLESESNTFDTNNENIKLQPNVIQNSLSIKNNNTDSATLSIKKTNYCNLCKRKFTKRCYFTNHMMMKHNINTNTLKQHTSIDCNESIILSKNIESTNEYKKKLLYPINKKNYNLSNHLNKNNDKKSTFCILCNKSFGHLGALTNHMRIHIEHPCDVCEKKFSTPLQLNAHRNKSHSEIVPYVCKICNKTYQLKNRWNCHLKSHYKKDNSNLNIKPHTNNLESNISKRNIESISHESKIKCRYCKKECNSISQWKNHMSMSKECHRHGKSYLPEFTSNKTVLDKTYLNTHDNTGSQKDKLMDIIQQKPAIKKRNRSNHINGAKCELCGKIYSNEYNLNRHISVIHKQTMTCNDCGITFKHKYSYEAHLRTHKQSFKHYEGTNSTCKKTSGQIISVNENNTMKYICEICKMKFADNITLQKHTNIHTLSMFKCNYCGQRYETNLALGNHIWENHSDI